MIQLFSFIYGSAYINDIKVTTFAALSSSVFTVGGTTPYGSCIDPTYKSLYIIGNSKKLIGKIDIATGTQTLFASAKFHFQKQPKS